jgi:hypothetical protein
VGSLSSSRKFITAGAEACYISCFFTTLFPLTDGGAYNFPPFPVPFLLFSAAPSLSSLSSLDDSTFFFFFFFSSFFFFFFDSDSSDSSSLSSF